MDSLHLGASVVGVGERCALVYGLGLAVVWEAAEALDGGGPEGEVPSGVSMYLSKEAYDVHHGYDVDHEYDVHHDVGQQGEMPSSVSMHRLGEAYDVHHGYDVHHDVGRQDQQDQLCELC